MPTSLDDFSALLVVDLQVATVAAPFARPVAEVVDATAALAADFRKHGRPVVYAVSTGTPAGRNAYGSEPRVFPEAGQVLAPGLDAHDDDLRVARAGLSIFNGTGLDERLRELGVETVVVTGVATTFGVESTVRSAYDLGFNVVVVSDAVTDMRAETHAHAFENVFPAVAQIATAEEVSDSLS
ncbi:cysteine hydrolase [Rhodococcus sp. NPDC003318]|uniref:cysteine hydrolase n=1 Tax=Rhodococcus sp. NPDC003318 TaxID=3364503 RepID=UPI0036B9F7E0